MLSRKITLKNCIRLTLLEQLDSKITAIFNLERMPSLQNYRMTKHKAIIHTKSTSSNVRSYKNWCTSRTEFYSEIKSKSSRKQVTLLCTLNFNMLTLQNPVTFILRLVPMNAHSWPAVQKLNLVKTFFFW